LLLFADVVADYRAVCDILGYDIGEIGVIIGTALLVGIAGAPACSISLPSRS
jgi:hypothetical protein